MIAKSQRALPETFSAPFISGFSQTCPKSISSVRLYCSSLIIVRWYGCFAEKLRIMISIAPIRERFEFSSTILHLPFDELLQRGKECTIHQNNLQKLMLEVYSSLTQQNPSFCGIYSMKRTIITIYDQRICWCCLKLTQLPMATIVYLFVVAYYGIPCLMIQKLPPPSVLLSHA